VSAIDDVAARLGGDMAHEKWLEGKARPYTGAEYLQ